ncbi:short-chain dehydrogenase reductase sdr [Lichtheimia corymbifera JMRC:FSU:9682]|uniref:Short-chain dehydrogenase reductase sdr n=1 Tax=Lichtheimia corymbifera JMRC:FSU:9682 TaxID=1263082 RepID=A0A068RSM4_9FUNG|nr:short-chain dehydrogenase reductase sdr [Lichtheimia corymbifera JMRC:FSU:9682]
MTNTKQFENRVAVITGGSRGIGKAVATALVEQGAKVVLGDVLEAEGEATAQEFNSKANAKVAAFIRTDVTKYKDNVAMFKLAETEFGGVDIAFLNAGIGQSDPLFGPIDDDADERIMDINTTAVMKGTKVALIHMAKRGGGTIVNTASFYGVYPEAFPCSYVASKHAVVGWTRSLYMLHKACNVRVNAVCPYYAGKESKREGNVIDVLIISALETDIIKFSPELGEQFPQLKLISKLPRVNVETVVKAVLTLMEDETRNAQVLLALPGDIIRPHQFTESLPEADTPEALQARKEYEEAYPELIKARLAASVEAYDKQYGSN